MRFLRVIAALVLLASAARAEDAPVTSTPETAGAEHGPGTGPETEPGASEPGFFDRETLTGDWGGMRKVLGDNGVEVGAEYIGETQGVVSGGLRRGAIYEGRFAISTDFDFEKLVGWEGATGHVHAYQIHGRGLSREFLGNLLPASNIEAAPSTRLFDAWVQQNFAGDRASIRLGQIAADDDFLISDTAATFMNSTFGWAALVANNLPSGGPAYPLATPGARLAVMPAEDVTWLTGVFSGDPAGRPGAEDPQTHNASGTTFSFEGGVLVMSEIQYALNRGKDAAGLPGTYKLGAFYHSGGFDDPRTDTLGLSLADPASSGAPRRHRGDYGVYAVADQMVWREPGSDNDRLNLFMRIGGTPADRNLVNFYVDGGAAYKGLIAGRSDDVAGVAVGYANLSGEASGFDSDVNAFNGTNGPLRDSETVVELTYDARICGWWRVQPDVQFIFNPGGNVADPNDPTGQSAIPDATVLGVRTAISF